MQEVVTIRPAELEVAPTFQGSLHETPVNIYRMKVDAQSADARRMSFGWRAPGNNLLCSPQAYLEFELDCQIPYTYTESEAVSAFYGMVDRSLGADNVNDAFQGGGTQMQKSVYAPNKLIIGARDSVNAPERPFAANANVWAAEIPGGRGYRAAISF